MKQEKLTKTRKMKGFSQYELATLINMEQTTYSRKERGIHDFTAREWEQMAQALGSTVEEIKEEKPMQYNENCTFNENSICCVGVHYATIPKELVEMMEKYIKVLERENESLRKGLKK